MLHVLNKLLMRTKEQEQGMSKNATKKFQSMNKLI